MNKPSNILLAFYGDDLTGSSDALEFICAAGVKTILFLDPPTLQQLNDYPGLQAYGVAGLTRSLSPVQMEKELLPAFQKIKETGANHVHYKVCSTFDSSPEVGSIGKAIDCGVTIFKNDFVPVLGGMPALGRYCVFGNLFARMGIGSNGKIYRLDRHPSMSKHPVTPSHESDLRLHLANQTNKKIGLISIVELEKDFENWNERIQIDDKVILLDALNETHLLKIGEWLEAQRNGGTTLFSVGSSGIEMALGLCWNKNNTIQPPHSWQKIEKASPLLVVSGSCSPVTDAQIALAKSNGFAEVILDPDKIYQNNAIDDELAERISDLLLSGKDTIIHTGQNRIESLPSEILGNALGELTKNVITHSKVTRVVIAGGDTSSYAARAMEIEALEMIAPLVIGAPLCKAYSKNKNINGIEINLKGGQVGSEDYFIAAKNGKNQESGTK